MLKVPSRGVSNNLGRTRLSKPFFRYDDENDDENDDEDIVSSVSFFVM